MAADSAASTSTDMKIDPQRASGLLTQLQRVQERIASTIKAGGPTASRPVRLVAVSKLKPANDVLALHQGPAAHAHFGENYVQELTLKAEMLPKTIQWHYIGGLQSSNCKNLARIPNLWCVSSVDTIKKANLLERHRAELIAACPMALPWPRLQIHVQVNTSGEDSKSGCAPGDEAVALCRAIAETCPSLHLLGLMTIGAIARSKAAAEGEENADFVLLREQRDLVARELGVEAETLELSMGMSDDFENAIALGSGEVRVGSTVFGERPAKADAKIAV